MHGLNITIPSYLYQSHTPGAEIVLDFVVKAFLTIRIIHILRIVIKIVHKRQYYSHCFPINNTALYTTG